MLLHDLPSLIPSNILTPPYEVILFQLRLRTIMDCAVSKYSPSSNALQSLIMFLLKSSSFKSGLDVFSPLHKNSRESSPNLLSLIFKRLKTSLLPIALLLIQVQRSRIHLRLIKFWDRSRFSRPSFRFSIMLAIPTVFLLLPKFILFGLRYFIEPPNAFPIPLPML